MQLQWAELRFDAYQIRWVADEIWHAEQTGALNPDGSYVLRIPYWDERELTRDGLRYAAGCEVMAAQALRANVAEMLRVAAAKHDDEKTPPPAALEMATGEEAAGN